MAWVVYDTWKLAQFGNDPVDFSGGDDIACILLTSDYTPDVEADEFVDPDLDLATNEVVGDGYTSGGVEVTGQDVSVTDHVLTVSCDTITFDREPAGFTDARYAVLIKDTGDETTSRVIAYYDLSTDRQNVTRDLVLEFPNGIFIA